MRGCGNVRRRRRSSSSSNRAEGDVPQEGRHGRHCSGTSSSHSHSGRAASSSSNAMQLFRTLQLCTLPILIALQAVHTATAGANPHLHVTAHVGEQEAATSIAGRADRSLKRQRPLSRDHQRQRHLGLRQCAFALPMPRSAAVAWPSSTTSRSRAAALPIAPAVSIGMLPCRHEQRPRSGGVALDAIVIGRRSGERSRGRRGSSGRELAKNVPPGLAKKVQGLLFGGGNPRKKSPREKEEAAAAAAATAVLAAAAARGASFAEKEAQRAQARRALYKDMTLLPLLVQSVIMGQQVKEEQWRGLRLFFRAASESFMERVETDAAKLLLLGQDDDGSNDSSSSSSSGSSSGSDSSSSSNDNSSSSVSYGMSAVGTAPPPTSLTTITGDQGVGGPFGSPFSSLFSTLFGDFDLNKIFPSTAGPGGADSRPRVQVLDNGRAATLLGGREVGSLRRQASLEKKPAMTVVVRWLFVAMIKRTAKQWDNLRVSVRAKGNLQALSGNLQRVTFDWDRLVMPQWQCTGGGHVSVTGVDLKVMRLPWQKFRAFRKPFEVYGSMHFRDEDLNRSPLVKQLLQRVLEAGFQKLKTVKGNLSTTLPGSEREKGKVFVKHAGILKGKLDVHGFIEYGGETETSSSSSADSLELRRSINQRESRRSSSSRRLKTQRRQIGIGSNNSNSSSSGSGSGSSTNTRSSFRRQPFNFRSVLCTKKNGHVMELGESELFYESLSMLNIPLNPLDKVFDVDIGDNARIERIAIEGDVLHLQYRVVLSPLPKRVIGGLSKRAVFLFDVSARLSVCFGRMLDNRLGLHFWGRKKVGAV